MALEILRMLGGQNEYLTPRVPHAKGLTRLVLLGGGQLLAGAPEQEYSPLKDAQDIIPSGFSLANKRIFQQRRGATRDYDACVHECCSAE